MTIIWVIMTLLLVLVAYMMGLDTGRKIAKDLMSELFEEYQELVAAFENYKKQHDSKKFTPRKNPKENNSQG